jgi:hypothetical protein
MLLGTKWELTYKRNEKKTERQSETHIYIKCTYKIIYIIHIKYIITIQ